MQFANKESLTTFPNCAVENWIPSCSRSSFASLSSSSCPAFTLTWNYAMESFYTCVWKFSKNIPLHELWTNLFIYQHSYAVKCFWTTCDKQRNQGQSLIFKVSSVNILCQNQQYLKGWCYQKIELFSPWASSSLVSIKPSPLFSLWHLLPDAST